MLDTTFIFDSHLPNVTISPFNKKSLQLMTKIHFANNLHIVKCNGSLNLKALI